MKNLTAIDRCTTCSICVTSCPVTRATRVYNGPKITGPSSQRFHLLSNAEIEVLDYCSSCKNCDIACPNGISISSMNMQARAEYCRVHRPSLRDWMLSHGSTMAKLTRHFPNRLVSFGMENLLSRRILDLFGVDRRAPLPVFAAQSFYTLFSQRKQLPARKKILFFPGCYINDYDPQTGLDVVWLLNQAGYEVVVPTADCCGLPLIANGFFDEATELARKNSGVLSAFAKNCDAVVSACPSCTLMLQKDYAEYFSDLPGYERLAPLICDAGQFLADCVADGNLKLPQGSGNYIYHAPCHLKAQGIGTPAFNLLKKTGLTVEDAGADCCGISGSYGFKKEKYDVSIAVGTPLFDAIKASSAQKVLSECGTCRIQISHHSGKPSLHPLSVFRELLEKERSL